MLASCVLGFAIIINRQAAMGLIRVRWEYYKYPRYDVKSRRHHQVIKNIILDHMEREEEKRVRQEENRRWVENWKRRALQRRKEQQRVSKEQQDQVVVVLPIAAEGYLFVV